MNISPYSNIEFINIDSFVQQEDEEPCLQNEDFDMEYLNNYLVEKFESEGYMSATESVFTLENQSQLSFFSETLTSKFLDNCETPTPPQEMSRSTCISPSEAPNECPEKIFTCDFENCKKSFKFKWILDRHYLSHKSVKLYKCTYRGCIKSYKSKENLTLHFKNIHLKEKPYSCRFCPSVFSHRNGKLFKIICNFTSLQGF